MKTAHVRFRSILVLGLASALTAAAGRASAWEVKDIIGTWEGKSRYEGNSQVNDCTMEIWEDDGELGAAVETLGYVVISPRVEFADDKLSITLAEFPELPEKNEVVEFTLGEDKVLRVPEGAHKGSEMKFLGTDDQIPVSDEDLAGIYTGIVRGEIALNPEGTETKKTETEYSVVIAVEGDLVGARVSGIKNRLDHKNPYYYDVLKFRRNGNRVLLECRLNKEQSRKAVEAGTRKKKPRVGDTGAIMGKITHSSLQASVFLPQLGMNRVVLIKQ